MIVDKYDGLYHLEITKSHVQIVANLKYSYTLHNEIFKGNCHQILDPIFHLAILSFLYPL